jgi:hypothetical protein
MPKSLKFTNWRYVDELGVFSVDNNPDANVGEPLSKGALVCKLPWSFKDGIGQALLLWGAARAASKSLGGVICLAAKIDGEWIACHHTNLSE